MEIWTFRRLLPALIAGLILTLPRPAVAQVSWNGAYAGGDIAFAIRTLDFSVADGWFRPTVLTGQVEPRVNVGGHAGFDYQIKRLVFGGEGGFSYLGYRGELTYGAAADTKATTKGGPAWIAMGRIGWVYRQVMPYFEAGVVGSRNSAAISDDCQKGPCGVETGHGSGMQTATRLALAYGLQLASTKKIAGRGWAVRIDWLQVDSKPIEN